MDAFTALMLGLIVWDMLSGRGVPNAAPVLSLAPATTAERDRVLDAVAQFGWPRVELNRVITRESGWVPSALNPASNAVGLVQFLPSTLKTLGFRADTNPETRALLFRRLSAAEQTPWIVKMFRGLPRWKLPGDTYLALAAPAFVGAPDATVIYDVGTAAWRLNPSLREPEGGPITARSIRARAI